jgi:hypothetical protein
MWALHTLQVESGICQTREPLLDIFIQSKLKMRHQYKLVSQYA